MDTYTAPVSAKFDAHEHYYPCHRASYIIP